MKKLIILLVLVGFSNLHAQEFKVGATLGLPLADAADISTVALGLDTYYYFTKQDAFFQLGVNASYRVFISNIRNGTNREYSQFLPISGAARLKIIGIFSGGADIGYAFGLSDHLDGGFYIRPVLAVDVLNFLELNLSYENISDAATWGNLNAGFLFQF